MVAFQRICICVVPLYMGRDLVAPGQDLFTIGAPDGLNRDMLVLNVASQTVGPAKGLLAAMAVFPSTKDEWAISA